MISIKWLPISILIVFTSLMILYGWYNYQHRVNRIIDRAVTNVQENAWQLSTDVEYAFQYQDVSQIKRKLSEFSLKKQASIAALIDRTDHIFLSTHSSWKGKEITLLFPEFATLIKQAWQQNDLIINNYNYQITAFMPIFSTDNRSIRPDKNYLLILGVDIKKDIRSAFLSTNI